MTPNVITGAAGSSATVNVGRGAERCNPKGRRPGTGAATSPQVLHPASPERSGACRRNMHSGECGVRTPGLGFRRAAMAVAFARARDISRAVGAPAST